MSTFYRDTTFLQIWGGTTFENTGEPIARTSTLITPAAPTTHVSNPWVMHSNERFQIELDTTDRGGGILLADPVVIESSIIPSSGQFPVPAADGWQTVTAMAVAAFAAENVQQLEFEATAGYVYRVSMNATQIGDIWAAVVMKNKNGAS